MMVDEATGGLEVSHRLALSSKDYSGVPGPVGGFKNTSSFVLSLILI